MCGLVGIWRRDGGEADRSAIASMLQPIGHRGPNGNGVWLEGHVAFGHVRLSIIDLTEAAHQPMLTADSNGVLIYNGEIYNYREIRHELERQGVRFRSSGDTEVVLQALHVWGPERSVKRFNGMFAFSYLDRREGALWLGRDRIGIKPLVIADTGAELLFASEAKALLAHPRVQKNVDRRALAKWIIAAGRGSQRMLFAGFNELEAGTLWKITKTAIEKHRYFHALTSVDVDRIVAASATNPSIFVGGFSERLKESVRIHLQSDAPLAAMCSGGVDSSLITAYAKQESPELRAYVADVAWPGGEGDQAERVGRHLEVPVQRVVVDQTRFLELWPRTVWHSDGPPTHPSDPALLAVAETCRAQGIKVLLTGEGSDELFGGYNWQQETYDVWHRLRSWRHFLKRRETRKALARVPFGTMAARLNPQLRNRLIIALDTELLPQRFLALLERVEPDADRAFLAQCFHSLYDHLSWILYRHDRIGMAASMEMRVPFLENGMFDFAFHLPRCAKLDRGIGKWVVKRAAAEVLPADIVYAKKKGFPMPKKFWRGTERLLVGGRLAEVMEWPADTTDEIVTLLGKDGYLRFQVVGLELWARIFLNGEAPAALGEKLTALAGDTTRAPSRQPNRRRHLVFSLWALLKALLRRLIQLARQGRRALRRQLWHRQGRLLNWFAVIRRKTLRHVTFIGVTGSCGKTTTTGLVAAVLESAGRSRMHAGDNRHRALIMNVLSVDASTKFCVQEVSGSAPGRIATHCRVLQPQVGIVTTVGSDHYKNYRSLEATARSKGQLVELLPSTGTAILNADDPHVIAMASRTSARVVTFGTCPNADVRATQISSAWPDRLTLTVRHGEDTLRIQTRLVGEHWTTSVLAAVACGLVCGVDLRECARAIENFEPMFGRHSVHVRPSGPVYIFDHKAPLWTIAVSVAFIKAARAPRTTIVFGTISDYSGSAGDRYRKVAREALEVADRVVFVGPNSGHVSRLRQREAQERLHAFETSYQASAFLAQATVPGELIYIKGSLQADHLERIMLSQLDRVVCWRERCRKTHACLDCGHYGIPELPPPSLVHGRSP